MIKKNLLNESELDELDETEETEEQGEETKVKEQPAVIEESKPAPVPQLIRSALVVDISILADRVLGTRTHVNMVSGETTTNKQREALVNKAKSKAIDMRKLLAAAAKIRARREIMMHTLEAKISELRTEYTALGDQQRALKEIVEQNRGSLLDTVLEDEGKAGAFQKDLAMSTFKAEAINGKRSKILAEIESLEEQKNTMLQEYKAEERAIWENARVDVSEGIKRALADAKGRCELLNDLLDRAKEVSAS